MAAKDNQGRDLDAVKKHFDREYESHVHGQEISRQKFEALTSKFPLADWTMFDNVLVLRCDESRFVAVPKSGKKTAKDFEVIDVKERVLVTVVNKDEVRSWLWRASQVEKGEG